MVATDSGLGLHDFCALLCCIASRALCQLPAHPPTDAAQTSIDTSATAPLQHSVVSDQLPPNPHAASCSASVPPECVAAVAPRQAAPSELSDGTCTVERDPAVFDVQRAAWTLGEVLAFVESAWRSEEASVAGAHSESSTGSARQALSSLNLRCEANSSHLSCTAAQQELPMSPEREAELPQWAGVGAGLEMEKFGLQGQDARSHAFVRGIALGEWEWLEGAVDVHARCLAALSERQLVLTPPRDTAGHGQPP